MELLEIPVTYKNEELCFKAHLIRSGYVDHIIVDVNGFEVTIERDEEGNYRALGDVEKMKAFKVDVNLIEEVMNVLQSL